LSIVIVSFNARDHLARCLSSIYQHEADDFEVVVVDNASQDGSADLVAKEFAAARLLRNKRNTGFAAAANLGADAAAGDVVLFLNPDSELTADAFSAPAALLRNNPDIGALGIKVLNPDGSLQLSVRRFPGLNTALFNRYSLFTRLLPRNRYSSSYLMTDWDHAQISDVDWLSGACLMTTRAVLDRVGPFDEGFFWGFEDVDFCQRLHRAGLRVVYDPETSVVHAIGASARSVPTRAVIARHRGMWRYYRRYLHSPVLDPFVFLGIAARCGVQVAATRLKRSPKVARTDVESGTSHDHPSAIL
jgi:GT2 family glycosyltransferase